MINNAKARLIQMLMANNNITQHIHIDFNKHLNLSNCHIPSETTMFHTMISTENYKSINMYKEKLLKYHAKIQQTRRQQIRAQNRCWNELPSVIIQIPARIEQSQWQHFELFLDHITAADAHLVTPELTQYLTDKFNQEELRQEGNPRKWECPNYFNILRIIMRLRKATSHHIQTSLSLLQQAHDLFSQCRHPEVLEPMLLLIKEIAIYLQNPEEEIALDEQNERDIKQIVSRIQIYMKWFQTKMPTNEQVFHRYRLYYITLVSSHLIDAESYVESRNVGELYFLIQDSLKYKQTFQIIQSLNIIAKILRMDQSRSQNLFAINGLHILLIDGLERAKLYTSSFQNIDITSINFQFGGQFMKRLLVLLSDSDLQTLVKSIEILGQLFSTSDSYIEAAIKVNNSTENTSSFEQNSKKNVTKLQKLKFDTYDAFFAFSMTSLLSQVRYQVYWVLSNIFGSCKFCFSYGLQFFKKIYQEMLIIEEVQNSNIKNQMKICVMNMMCNIELAPHLIEDLIKIQFQKQAHQKAEIKNSDNYPQNGLAFCLEVIFTVLEEQFQIQEKATEIVMENLETMLSRSIYALFLLLQTTKRQNYPQIHDRIVDESHRRRIPIYLETLAIKIRSKKCGNNIQCMIDELLNKLEDSHEHL